MSGSTRPGPDHSPRRTVRGLLVAAGAGALMAGIFGAAAASHDSADAAGIFSSQTQSSGIFLADSGIFRSSSSGIFSAASSGIFNSQSANSGIFAAPQAGIFTADSGIF